ncbi:hypothetical protein BpHYR1_051732 [Brachionus plicatilis]|uniref:Uncharacterized protein n=1 Tax=Brachionus plicatilis TaxID=10195 RepID=A0A3M7QHC5_BRAPC|nr:hypothetical protein BpHYR1_051732 [Brachionus plicatilis]
MNYTGTKTKITYIGNNYTNILLYPLYSTCLTQCFPAEKKLVFLNINILKEHEILYMLLCGDKILNKSMIKLENSIFLGAQLLFFCIFLINMLLGLDRMNHQTTNKY